METTQKTIAQLLMYQSRTYSNICKIFFETGELDENSVVKEILTTAPDNKKYQNINQFNKLYVSDFDTFFRRI